MGAFLTFPGSQALLRKWVVHLGVFWNSQAGAQRGLTVRSRTWCCVLKLCLHGKYVVLFIFIWDLGGS